MIKFAKRALLGTAIAAVMSAPAMAADFFDYEPPVEKFYDEPVYKDYVPELPPEEPFGGWYLRGHIGMSNQGFSGLDYFRYDDPAIDVIWLDEGGFGSAPLFGIGVGYQVNHWLRGDLTAEYRGKASFNALDRIVDADDNDIIYGINDYRAKKSELLFLANAYADLGNFHGITPYIGAGIGASRNTISHFNDSNIWTGGGGYAGRNSKWNFAWALHAGVGYEIGPRTTLDLGYSYVNLGDAKTGPAHNYDPAWTAPNDGFTFKKLHSHDLKLGVRYRLN